MFDTFHGDPTKDLPDVMTIRLRNNVIYIKKQDPYGWWTVNFDKGQMPEILNGAFTTDILARDAVMQYLARKKRLWELNEVYHG